MHRQSRAVPLPKGVEGPISYVHLRHAGLDKEIILCGDVHRDLGGCGSIPGDSKTSFLSWAKEQAQKLHHDSPHNIMDLFVEGETITEQRPTPFVLQSNQQGYLFGQVFQELDEWKCLEKNQKKCRQHLNTNYYSMRVHSVDPRGSAVRFFHVIDMCSDLSKTLPYAVENATFRFNLKHLIAVLRRFVADLLSPQTTIKMEQTALLHKAKWSKDLKIPGIRTKRQFEIWRDAQLRNLSTFDLAYTMVQYIEKRSDVNWKRSEFTPEWLAGHINNALNKVFNPFFEDMKLWEKSAVKSDLSPTAIVKTALSLKTYLTVYVDPIMDMYAITRFFKPYISRCIYYAGQAHCLKMGLMLLNLGFEVVTQQPLPLFLTNTPKGKKSKMHRSFEAGARAVLAIDQAQNISLASIGKPASDIVAWQRVFNIRENRWQVIYKTPRSTKTSEINDGLRLSQCLTAPTFS